MPRCLEDRPHRATGSGKRVFVRHDRRGFAPAKLLAEYVAGRPKRTGAQLEVTRFSCGGEGGFDQVTGRRIGHVGWPFGKRAACKYKSPTAGQWGFNS
jgi:hypothetical protein